MSRRIFVLFCLLITLLLITGFAQAQQSKRVPRIGILVGGSASSDSARIESLRRGCASLGTSRGKTSRLNTGTQTENPIVCLRLLRNWSPSRLISSSQLVQQRPVLRKKQQRRLRSSWRKLM